MIRKIVTTGAVAIAMVVLSSCSAKLGSYKPNYTSGEAPPPKFDNGFNKNKNNNKKKEEVVVLEEEPDLWKETGDLDGSLSDKDNEQYTETHYQTIYFAFDQSIVGTTERVKLDALAKDMNNEPTLKVKVEGHCDERGSDEYNRGLGERRALSVKEYLIQLGVSADRIITQSFGEEKPAVEGNTESAYSKNRRAETIILKPKKLITSTK